MPLYVFRAENGTEFEEEFPLGSAPDKIDTDAGPAKRVIAWSGGMTFKGGGWARRSS